MFLTMKKNSLMAILMIAFANVCLSSVHAFQEEQFPREPKVAKASNEAEKAMYRLCAQDEARHVAFGVMHMRYMAETAPERHEEIDCYLDEAERQILAGSQNPAGAQAESSESLAILLGGGKDKYDEGVNKLIAIRRRQLQEYQKRVRSAGFGARFDNGRSPIKDMLAASAA